MDEYISFMIKVFKLRELIKFIISIIIPLIIILLVVKIVQKNVNAQETKSVNIKQVTSIIEDNIDMLKISQRKENNNILKWGKVFLDNEFGIIEEENAEEEPISTPPEETTVDNQAEESKKEEKVEQAETEITIEQIPNDVKPAYNREFNSIKINNSTEYELTDELLNPENIQINKNKVIIYHTHTCESYTPTEQYWYEGTGNYRTTDLNYSVVRVGEELKKQLESYGCEVIHDKTLHDYPAYSGSYSRSLKTVQNLIDENRDVDIVIDLHRDAIADPNYAPKIKIGNELASQLLFVIGTDKANPAHTSWGENLRFAVKTQLKANELYPGLFKPIILRNSTYNQNVAKSACIIEVGATGNTLEESLNSMKYLAKVLKEL